MNPLIVHIVFSDGRREARAVAPGVHGPSNAEIVDLGSTNGTFDVSGQRQASASPRRPRWFPIDPVEDMAVATKQSDGLQIDTP